MMIRLVDEAGENVVVDKHVTHRDHRGLRRIRGGALSGFRLLPAGADHEKREHARDESRYENRFTHGEVLLSETGIHQKKKTYYEPGKRRCQSPRRTSFSLAQPAAAQ